LGSAESAEDESFGDGLLEYPQYTRPAEFRGMKVPEILLGGHHANIAKWRRQQSLKKTFEMRPDLLEKAELTKADRAYLKELAENRDETYDQQYSQIMKEYNEKIEGLKQQYIFKIVNFLNWLYYNDVNRDLAWSVVLLRLSVITHNKYHNEQHKHDEKDFADYIKNYKFSNTRELLELYVAIIVYKYQFIEHSIIGYDREYIETMIHYLTDTLPSFDEYIDNLMVNIFDNITILRLLLPTEQLMKVIIEKCLNKFTYKVKPLYDTLLKFYSQEELEQYGIVGRIKLLTESADICKLFNKTTGMNYKSIVEQLNAYSPDIILECFKNSCLSNYGPYTKYVLQYMMTLFTKQQLSDTIKEYFTDKQKINKIISPLFGLLIVGLEDTSFYEYSADKITTLLEASNSKPAPAIIEFIVEKAKEKLTKAKGYDKFQLETIIGNLE
jgi:hypothetical protein